MELLQRYDQKISTVELLKIKPHLQVTQNMRRGGRNLSYAAGLGAGRTSGALPDAHRQAAAEEHVEQILHLVRDLEAEAFPDHHVPGGAELLVHHLFDHLGSALRDMKKESRG